MPEIVRHKLEVEYKRYLICGSMPEAVTTLLGNEGMHAVENVLQQILDLYTLDFAKYAAPIFRESTVYGAPCLLSQLKRTGNFFIK